MLEPATLPVMPAARVVHDTPCCRIVSRDAPLTILVFSQVNVPVGKFGASRALAEVDCNVVFLNCPHNGWYLNGIPGLGATPEAAAEELGRLLARHGISGDKRVTWGGSMGGFGAVVYGALMGVETIVAFGAELKLLVAGGKSEGILVKRQKRGDIPAFDVRAAVRDSPGRFFLYAGEMFYPDLVSAGIIMDLPNVEVTTLADFGHPLANHVNERYGLAPFLEHHIREGSVFPFAEGEAGNLKERSHLWDTLHSVSQGQGEPERGRLLAEAEETTDPYWKMHCHNALSLGATRTGATQTAVEQARFAKRACPGSRFANYRLCMALKRAGAPAERWLKVARGIPGFNRPAVFHPVETLLPVMVQAYADSGKAREGIAFLEEQLALPDTSPGMKQVLADFIARLSASRPWKVSFSPEARDQCPGLQLDHEVVRSVGDEVILNGVVLFPDHWGDPVRFSGEGVEVVRVDAGIPSKGFGKKHPGVGRAENSRVKMTVRITSESGGKVHARDEAGNQACVFMLDPALA